MTDTPSVEETNRLENQLKSAMTLTPTPSSNDDHEELERKLSSSGGWGIVPTEECPSRGLYYPEGAIIRVKSPTAANIKNYSRMDSNIPSTVEYHIDEIMEENVSIEFGNGKKGNSKDLTQFDKIHFLFLLRDRAMRNFNSKRELFQTVKNPKKPEEEKKVKIDYSIFEYYQIPKGIMKWYDNNLRCFRILDQSQLPHVDIKIYIPTVGVNNWIKDHIRGLEIRKQSGQEEIYYDEQFFKILQYLVPDWRLLKDEEFVEKTRKWYNDLDLEIFDILTKIADEISFGIKPNIKVKFGDEEVIVPIRFREYKSIFSISDRASILLSDTE